MSKAKKITNSNTNMAAAHADTSSTVQRITRARNSSTTVQSESANQPIIQAPIRIKRTKEQITAAKAEKEKMKAEKAVEKAQRLAEREEAKKSAIKEKEYADEIKKQKLDILRKMEMEMEEHEHTETIMSSTIKTIPITNITNSALYIGTSTSGPDISNPEIATATTTATKSVRWKDPESTSIDPPNEDEYSSDTSLAVTEIVEEDSAEALGVDLERNTIGQNILGQERSINLLYGSSESHEQVSTQNLSLSSDSHTNTTQNTGRLILRIPSRKVLQQSDINQPITGLGKDNGSKTKTNVSLTLTAPSDDSDVSDVVRGDILPAQTRNMVVVSDEDIDVDIESDKAATNYNTNCAGSTSDLAIQDDDINVNISKQKGKRRMSDENLSETRLV